MPPIALRSLLRAARLPRPSQSSPFASSSRSGLDFTSPLRAEPPRFSTTLVDEPSQTTTEPSTTEDQPKPETSPTPSEPSPTPEQPSPSPSRKVPPRPTPIPTPTRSPLFDLNPPSQPSKLRKGELKPLRYSPEDASSDFTALTHTLTISSSRNNVILSFTDSLGVLLPTITGGTGGIFKKSNRNSYEAGYQASLKMIARIVEYSRNVPRVRMRVAFKGMFGSGREAVATALGGNEGSEVRGLIGRVEDRTPYVITGTRQRKRRRI